MDVREVAALVSGHVGTCLDGPDLACKQTAVGGAWLAAEVDT